MCPGWKKSSLTVDVVPVVVAPMEVVAPDPQQPVEVVVRDPPMEVVVQDPLQPVEVVVPDPQQPVEVVVPDPQRPVEVVAQDPLQPVEAVVRDPRMEVVAQDPLQPVEAVVQDCVGKQFVIRDFTISEGDFVTAVTSKRWYVAKVKSFKKKQESVLLQYMKPVHGKWKWGQRSIGGLPTSAVLCKVKAPVKSGNLLDLDPEDKLKTQVLFSSYK
jgi:hypothetical protein